MTVRKIILILGLFSLGLPNLAYADEGAPFSSAELDKICSYFEETAGQITPTGLSVAETCDEMAFSPVKEWSLGYHARILFDVKYVDFLLTYLETHDPPQEDLANFWIWEMREESRAREFENLLHRYSVNQDVIDEFHDLRERFTLLVQNREFVLHHRGFSQKKRQELVYSAEEQMAGLSASLKALLNKIFSNNSSSSALTLEFKEKLKELLGQVWIDRSLMKRREDKLSDRMSLAIIKDEEEKFQVKFKACLQQRGKVREAWSEFGADFSLWELSPDLLLNSRHYQVFAKEQKAYDECVLSLYQSAMGSYRQLLIYSTFRFRPPFKRTNKRLNGMEYLFFIEAMIRAIDQFSVAQKWQWALNNSTQEWLPSNVDVLTGAWLSLAKNASESPGGGQVLLYFVPPANSEGRFEPRFAGWLIGRWLAQSDIDGLMDQGRVVTFEGDFYLLPPTYAFRTINSAERLQRFKAMPILEVVIK